MDGSQQVSVPGCQGRATGVFEYALRPEVLAWGFIVLGAALRLFFYLSNRSLWRDEAALALDIMSRSPLGLLRPLDYGQVAPVAPAGFLVLVESVTAALGTGELALRLVSLVAGLAALPLFWALARRVLDPPAAALAALLFALSPPLVRYSAEFKQYSLDLALGLVLTTALLWASGQKLTLRRGLLLALLGAASVWFSHPAIFILCGGGLGLWAWSVAGRDWKRVVALAAVGATWVLSFGLYWVVSLAQTSRNDYLVEYWSGAFLPMPPFTLRALGWLGQALIGIFSEPAGLSLAVLAAFCFVLGAAAVWRQDRQRLLILISPALVALLASAAQKYPFEGRLLIFFAPTLLLLTAAGVRYIQVRLGGRRLLGLVLAAALLWGPVVWAARRVSHGPKYVEVRPVMEHVARYARAGDVLYVYYAGLEAFDYYRPRFDLDRVEVIRGKQSRGNWPGYEADLSQLRGRGRVWVLFSHSVTPSGIDERLLFLGYLDTLGRRRHNFQAWGASVYLYEFRDSAGALQAPPGLSLDGEPQAEATARLGT